MEKTKKMSNRRLITLFSLAALGVIATDFALGEHFNKKSNERMAKMEQETKAHVKSLSR